MNERLTDAIIRLIDTQQIQRRVILEEIAQLDPHMNNYITKKCDLESQVLNIDHNVLQYLDKLK